MKTLKKIFLPLLLLLTVCAQLFAQNNDPIISGTFEYLTKKMPDSMVIWTFDSHWETTVDYYAQIDKNNRFSFKLPHRTTPRTIKLQLMNGGKVTSLGTFFIETNDNVHVNIIETANLQRDSLVFSGKGSSKYNVAKTLQNDFWYYLTTGRKVLPAPKSSISTDSLNIYLEEKLKFVENLRKKRLALIESHSDIDHEMKKILDYGLPGYNFSWCSHVATLYKETFKNNEQSKQLIRAYFNKNYYRLIGRLDEASYIAPLHCQAFSHAVKMNLWINNETDGVDLKTYYDAIKNLYEGKIKERLLAEFLMSPYTMINIINYNPLTYDSLVKDASKYMLSSKSREIIATKLNFKPGSKLFQANFLDLNGQQFNLSSMRGKVFLVDIWGTGCGGCSSFHQRFEREIWPFLKNNQDFSILAIHNGKTKKRWIEGIESKLYTRSEYVNIATVPQGNNHPFMKHYEINYAPCLLLVDKEGMIISHISHTLQSKELLKLINSALGTVKTAI